MDNYHCQCLVLIRICLWSNMLDDTLLDMPACKEQIIALKHMLQVFAASTSLKVNYSKYMLIPLNVPDDTSKCLAEALGFPIGSLPFPYLGLPMGTTRSSISDLTPLVHIIERRLSSASCYLNQDGRLPLSMTIYHPCTLAIPKGIIYKTY